MNFSAYLVVAWLGLILAVDIVLIITSKKKGK